MPVVRYLVNDVDESLPFYKALGFKLADRWGPPFAIVRRKSLSVWLSAPGTSARKKLKNGATPEPGGWNRIVLEVKDIEVTVKASAPSFGASQSQDRAESRFLWKTHPETRLNSSNRAQTTVRPNPSFKLIRYGSYRLAAPDHCASCPSAASRRLPPRSD